MGKICLAKTKGSEGKSQESKGLVITLHLKFQSIGQLLSKHMHLLYMGQETKKIFTPGPMAKFCRARKLSSNLKMAKLYPIERIVGSHKCKDKRCEVCLSVREITSFSSPVTNEAYKVNHQFACNKKCIYGLSKNV